MRRANRAMVRNETRPKNSCGSSFASLAGLSGEVGDLPGRPKWMVSDAALRAVVPVRVAGFRNPEPTSIGSNQVQANFNDLRGHSCLQAGARHLPPSAIPRSGRGHHVVFDCVVPAGAEVRRRAGDSGSGGDSSLSRTAPHCAFHSSRWLSHQKFCCWLSHAQWRREAPAQSSNDRCAESKSESSSGRGFARAWRSFATICAATSRGTFR